jgi:hypothetical protein
MPSQVRRAGAKAMINYWISSDEDCSRCFTYNEFTESCLYNEDLNGIGQGDESFSDADKGLLK